MPYIKRKRRPWIDPAVTILAKTLLETADPFARAGELNYAITKLLLAVFPERRYGTMALVRGVLSDIATEYYRRRVAPYEEEKIAENGDVYDA